MKRSPTLSRLLYADQKTYLVELLMKQDQMSMACSIESRVPFLDHVFVEFAATVPPHMKLRGKEGKYILKKAVGICFRKTSSIARRWASPRRCATGCCMTARQASRRTICAIPRAFWPST